MAALVEGDRDHLRLPAEPDDLVLDDLQQFGFDQCSWITTPRMFLPALRSS